MDQAHRPATTSPAPQQGQALVELALVLPFLLLLAVGTIELGRALLAMGSVEAGAYRGVTYAAFTRANTMDPAIIRESVVADWGPLPVSDANPPVAVVVGQERLTCPQAAFPCTSQPTDQVSFDAVQVQVTYTYTPLLPWPGVPTIPILRTSVAMRVEP